MRIISSEIHLASSREYTEKHEKKESLTVWQDGRERISINDGVLQREGLDQIESLGTVAVQVTLSEEARRLPPSEDVVPAGPPGEIMDSAELNILRLLVEFLTGKKINIAKPEDLHPEEDAVAVDATVVEASGTEGERLGWGLIYDYQESHYESESTQFSGQGIIRTADGVEIEFTVDLTMSREFMHHESINIRAGDALVDPLVINFGGRAAELTQTHFAFDLDLDGHEDQISFVKDGSGFLALDRNNDNIINDGSELFGPATGNGFAELARYDDDSNNWIDENDAIYEKLRIWSRDSAGNHRLFALGSKGVGAIFLGHVATPFSLTNPDNEMQGQIRTSGIYVKEDTSIGTIQQLDMVI